MNSVQQKSQNIVASTLSMPIAESDYDNDEPSLKQDESNSKPEQLPFDKFINKLEEPKIEVKPSLFQLMSQKM